MGRFYVCVFVCLYMFAISGKLSYIYIVCVFLNVWMYIRFLPESMGVRKGHPTLLSWSYKLLSAAAWVLGTEPSSSTSALGTHSQLQSPLSSPSSHYMSRQGPSLNPELHSSVRPANKLQSWLKECTPLYRVIRGGPRSSDVHSGHVTG